MFQKILSGSQNGVGAEEGTEEECGGWFRREGLEPHECRGVGETEHFLGKENVE